MLRVSAVNYSNTSVFQTKIKIDNKDLCGNLWEICVPPAVYLCDTITTDPDKWYWCSGRSKHCIFVWKRILLDAYSATVHSKTIGNARRFRLKYMYWKTLSKVENFQNGPLSYYFTRAYATCGIFAKPVAGTENAASFVWTERFRWRRIVSKKKNTFFSVF